MLNVIFDKWKTLFQTFSKISEFIYVFKSKKEYYFNIKKISRDSLLIFIRKLNFAKIYKMMIIDKFRNINFNNRVKESLLTLE